RAIDDPMNPAPPVTRYRLIARDLLPGSTQQKLVSAGELADVPLQRRIAHVAIERSERSGRIAQLAVLPRRGGRSRQRVHREPGGHDQSRDDPEEPSVCRHRPTLSHSSNSANFWPFSFAVLKTS